MVQAPHCVISLLDKQLKIFLNNGNNDGRDIKLRTLDAPIILCIL